MVDAAVEVVLDSEVLVADVDGEAAEVVVVVVEVVVVGRVVSGVGVVVAVTSLSLLTILSSPGTSPSPLSMLTILAIA